MSIVLKILGILILIGGLAFIGFAYVGDLDPDPRAVTLPVDLDAD